MIVVLTDQGNSDLKDIAEWISRDHPGRAATFVRELRERCHSLSMHPARFPIAFDSPVRTVRKLTHGNYLIFYAILTDRIDILRIVHSSRDWASLFEAP